MIKRSDYRSNDIPSKPGVYVFRDRFETVIYVGKAKSLRKRLASYFQASRSKPADPRIRSLINSIAFIELNVVKTEQESLLLEDRLIKEFTPGSKFHHNHQMFWRVDHFHNISDAWFLDSL